MKIQKGIGGGDVGGWGQGGGVRSGVGEGGSKVRGRWVMLGMGDVNQE